MTSSDNLFGRLLKRTPLAADPPEHIAAQSMGLHVQLDHEGHVLQIAGPLRLLLAQHGPHEQPLHLHHYVLPHSTLPLEGPPADWQGQMLDLDFSGLGDQTLHLRGWVQPMPQGWLLQLMDIADLLRERQQARSRDACQGMAGQISEQLRACSLSRLPVIVGEQLHAIAQRWHLPCVALALLDEQEQGWQIYRQFNAHDAPSLWQDGQRLGTSLDSLNGTTLQHLGARHGLNEHLRVQAIFGNAEGFAVPYSDDRGVAAWLLCGFYPVQEPAPGLSDRDWLMLVSALASPLLSRLREQQHHLQLERMESLQALLGTGWWEAFDVSDEVLLAPSLASALALNNPRLAFDDWLLQIHPTDREELRSRLKALQEQGEALTLCVRLHRSDAAQNPRWYRLQGQAIGAGEHRRLVGFMLDISDIKNQQQQATAAHARLDNLIASSPAVIYVQRYVEGALLPTFFSASLQPLLGWNLNDCNAQALAQRVHPDDRDRYFERTRQLLREGTVRARYRLLDSHGDYHWLLDEAKLLRDDLGLPVEAVGLWLDVTEATLAAEQVKHSEERYRMLVEDSPAMICRYRPDLTLTFGNRPLATYMECAPEQLPGVNLGSWMSDEQREAFVQRIHQLSPERPVNTAEISLQLPGREHAWWVWSDRGVFDEQGQLVEVQAVGRDNTEVRRSQQQLTQSAKMATLGEMATGLAHEINQPLNVMRMAIVNVLKRLGNGDIQIDYLTEKLNRIDAQVQRAARVVDHMRVFGRRSEIEQHPFNPADAIEGTLSLLAEGMRGKGVDLRVSEIGFTVHVRGYVDQLEQVLINLMVNARDALLSKRETDHELKPWISLYAERDERYVRLWVEDNGGGIDARLLERIFEPFFTTKPVGVGTGLGLSVSYGIVENMGGRLSVSNSTEGARFCIELPIILDV
ncbi:MULTISPECIES: ATP-binding protein [unclassified Pseudomonas]|uniref:PAS domain-containing sensor histidine kinase n=1 Tax=unclassified Pseudomonas TaxID=196821 RepID=UPI002AC98A70|nr:MULTISPECIES: ATP-binding protein [unclassified Pseudomonas]MEB0046882.1 PAS domain-containing protein [Pseudomonas sp. Dout3]MEB0098642.1 PAS domain-containing protein [Pseudomonas sp. DC1.2]WPX59608.1 PAS domain-containing protein [Pseudomonas sp. DC1.2]